MPGIFTVGAEANPNPKAYGLEQVANSPFILSSSQLLAVRGPLFPILSLYRPATYLEHGVP